MALIHTDPAAGATIRGAEHGASVSLILDHSSPGQGPRGSEPCSLVCIHASPTIIGEWLE